MRLRWLLFRAALSANPSLCVHVHTDEKRLRKLIDERLNQFATELAEVMASRRDH